MCQKDLGFIFYKHREKEQAFYQDSHEACLKHEETTRTRPTVLEFRQYGRMDGIVRTPLCSYALFLLPQKALDRFCFFSCLMDENLA